MALNKSIEDRKGNTSSYHRISVINRDMNNDIKVIVESYKDKAARIALKEPMSNQICSLSHASINLSEAMLEQIYTQLKLLPQFSGASDE